MSIMELNLLNANSMAAASPNPLEAPRINAQSPSPQDDIPDIILLFPLYKKMTFPEILVCQFTSVFRERFFPFSVYEYQVRDLDGVVIATYKDKSSCHWPHGYAAGTNLP